MSPADPKVLAAVNAFLDRQKLDHTSEDSQYCTQLQIRKAAQKATISVYNTGKIVVGGPNSPLKAFLSEMAKVIESGEAEPGQPLPFEIDKFPDLIKERVPECDPVIVAFVEEAILCIRHDALLAAAFMIGAASERAINLLIHTYADAIKDDGNKGKFSGRINNKMISKKYDEFLASYKGCKSQPTDAVLSHDLDVIIGVMFQFCRITRNEVGHPQIVPDLNKGVLLANLGSFVTYIERIYKLMKHFRESGVIL